MQFKTKHIKFLANITWLISFIMVAQHAVGQMPSIVDQADHQALAEKAVRSVYRWDFEKARHLAEELETEMPQHPAAPFLKAMILYWENIPFDFESQAYAQHMAHLEDAYERTEHYLDVDKDNIEAKFFKMMIRSVQIRNYDDNGQTMKTIGVAKQIYGLIMDGFEEKEELTEFYFPVGLYNYYREYYPEAHPVYKPFMFFFKSGDKALGLEQMQYAANNAIFTKPEALGYLAYIYYRDENKPLEALKYMKCINNLYPGNLHYLTSYTEALVLEKKYEEARPFVEQLLASDRAYFHMAGLVYQGMMAEKLDEDITAAADRYEAARKIASISHTPWPTM